MSVNSNSGLKRSRPTTPTGLPTGSPLSNDRNVRQRTEFSRPSSPLDSLPLDLLERTIHTPEPSSSSSSLDLSQQQEVHAPQLGLASPAGLPNNNGRIIVSQLSQQRNLAGQQPIQQAVAVAGAVGTDVYNRQYSMPSQSQTQSRMQIFIEQPRQAQLQLQLGQTTRSLVQTTSNHSTVDITHNNNFVPQQQDQQPIPYDFGVARGQNHEVHDHSDNPEQSSNKNALNTSKKRVADPDNPGKMVTNSALRKRKKRVSDPRNPDRMITKDALRMREYRKKQRANNPEFRAKEAERFRKYRERKKAAEAIQQALLHDAKEQKQDGDKKPRPKT